MFRAAKQPRFSVGNEMWFHMGLERRYSGTRRCRRSTWNLDAVDAFTGVELFLPLMLGAFYSSNPGLSQVVARFPIEQIA